MEVTTLLDAGILWRKLEARVDAREEAHKEAQAKDKRAMEQLQIFMLKTLNGRQEKAVDIEGVGHIAVVTKTTYSGSDWPLFGDYVLKHGLTELYQKRIHEGNMQKYIDTPAMAGNLPPGISVFSTNIIKITKGRT